MEFSQDGRRYVEIDQDQDRFDGHDIKEFPRIAKDIINEKFNGKVIGHDNKMFVNGQGRDEFSNPSKYITGDIYEAKMRSAGELDNLLDAGINLRNVPDGQDGHYHPDVIGGFDHYDTLFKIGNRYYEAVVNIKNIAKGKLFKDVTKIKDVTQDIMSSYGQNPKSQFLRTSSKDIIPESQENTTKNSLSRDSDGNSVNENMQLYMKDTKAVDADGALMKVYHGTVREFYTFDRSYANAEGNMGKGFYFTNNVNDVDENYANENGADLTSKIEREADLLEGMEEYEDMDHDEIVEMLREKYMLNNAPLLAGRSTTAILIPFIGMNSVYWANVINGIITTIIVWVYAWGCNRRFPTTVTELMVIPKDFGAALTDRIDITVRSMEEVVTVSRQVQVFCWEKGVDTRRSFLAALMVEEMAGNIVSHGFEKDNKKHSVDMRIVYKAKTDELILRIKDDCIPFDPAERQRIVDPDDITKNIGIRIVYSVEQCTTFGGSFNLRQKEYGDVCSCSYP